MSKLLHYDLSCKVLEAAFKVHRALGPCLLEAVYEGGFCVELSRMGISYERQQVFPVEYCGEYIGTYFADVVVANTIIVELKSVKCITDIAAAQIINYLRLSGLQVASCMPSLATPLPAVPGRPGMSSTFTVSGWSGSGSLIREAGNGPASGFFKGIVR